MQRAQGRTGPKAGQGRGGEAGARPAPGTVSVGVGHEREGLEGRVLLRGKRAAQGGGRPDGSPRKYALQLFPILWCRRRQPSLRALAYTIAY